MQEFYRLISFSLRFVLLFFCICREAEKRALAVFNNIFGRKLLAGKIFIIIFAAKISDMAIRLLSAKQFATKLKATIQASGRLGFTAETATALGLESGKFARFAQDDENGSLYLIINSERSEDAFEIRVSSGYYYVPTKVMFDTLGYNYEDGNIMFDLIRQPSLDNDLQGLVYFMKQRQTKNKEKKNDITSEP